MRNWFSKLLAIVIILGALSPAALKPAEAQTPPPPPEPERQHHCLPGQPCEDENGERFVLPTEETLAEPTAIGDMDDYGYTLTSTTYAWIDATTGTNTGINSWDDMTAAISLPWAFPFYENSYSQLYITGAGYATFEESWVNDYFDIPEESEPNNLISVLSKYHYYSNGAVYYRNYGTHFVIQWNNVKDGNGSAYTFEAVLYPNGNIKFQYKTLPDPSQGYYYCSTAGIENATGLDGLAFWNYCDYPTSSNTAVFFTRPAPSARVGANPLYLGEFAYALDVDDFTFTLTNSGDLGADTYDMLVTTAPLGAGWNAELFNAATLLPLADTDADGTIDSGLLAQGASMEILVRVSAPAGLAIGARNTTYVDVTSSLNTSKTKTITIDSTVPAAFAQTYKDSSDYILKTDLNWTPTQLQVDISGDAWNAVYPTVIETPEHNFVQVWSEYMSGASGWGMALRYAVIDRFGHIVKVPEILSPIYDVANYDSYQTNLKLAVTADGKIGVIWVKYIYDPANLVNYNIWFAVLNPTGSLAYGPANLTNDNNWGSYQNDNRVRFSSADLSASADNRFMATWEKYVDANETEDIYYTIRQSSGAQAVPVTKMTASTSTSWYYPRVQIALSGNRFFVAYSHQWQSGQYYYGESLYRVFDSSGGTLTPPTTLNFSPSAAVQLSGGNILMAENVYNGNEYYVMYRILNGTTYGSIAEGELSHPSSDVGYGTLSVTKDANNRGILTWSDENQRYLYYALVSGSNGAVLTNPVIFHRSDGFELSYNGSSITTNSWSPAEGVDLATHFTSELFGGAPGGMASVWLDFMNTGAVTSAATQLVLTLPDGLSYAADSSGITPDIVGNTVTWDLPDIPFGEGDGFQVWVYIDGSAVAGTLYPISLAISSGSADANPADNTDSAQVLAGLMHFLPTLFR